MVHGVVFNTYSPNLVFWVSIVVDIQTVSIAIASASVIAGVVYYALQIRHQTRIRKTDLTIRLYSRLHSGEFDDAYPRIMSLEFKDYEDFVKRYGRRHSGKSPEIDKAISTVCGFFELTGTLLYRKHIDLGLVYDVFGIGMVKEIYEKTKPLAVGTRRELDDPNWGVGFDYLYNELLRKEPQLRKTLPKASAPSISDSNSSNQSSRC
jgi:hypothetical protein